MVPQPGSPRCRGRGERPCSPGWLGVARLPTGATDRAPSLARAAAWDPIHSKWWCDWQRAVLWTRTVHSSPGVADGVGTPLERSGPGSRSRTSRPCVEHVPVAGVAPGLSGENDVDRRLQHSRRIELPRLHSGQPVPLGPAQLFREDPARELKASHGVLDRDPWAGEVSITRYVVQDEPGLDHTAGGDHLPENFAADQQLREADLFLGTGHEPTTLSTFLYRRLACALPSAGQGVRWYQEAE
jgi:hypothetical protein